MEEQLTGFYSPDNKNRLCSLLEKGGIAVLPTDTIYGFHCISSDNKAVSRVGRMKGREAKAGFILIASDITMVDHLVSDWPPRVRELLSDIWPASLTAILPASQKLLKVLRPGGRVAVRVPDTPILREITRVIGTPLISTSVNISGEPHLGSITEIMRRFPGLQAYMSRKGRPAVLPSTIVDFCGDTFSVLRKGSYLPGILAGEAPSGKGMT